MQHLECKALAQSQQQIFLKKGPKRLFVKGTAAKSLLISFAFLPD
jgi:hypothetical protein